MKIDYNQIVNICSAASTSFSFASWIAVVKPKLDKQQLFLPFDYGAIEIACFTASLMAIRKFDDFFANKRNRHDDVIASDFNYNSSGILTIPERKSINKCVAHFTTEMENNAEQSWAIDDLLQRLSTPLKDFLHFLLKQCEEKQSGEYFEISETIKFIDAGLLNLSSHA